MEAVKNEFIRLKEWQNLMEEYDKFFYADDGIFTFSLFDKELKQYNSSKNISMKNLSIAIIVIKEFFNKIDKLEDIIEFFITIINEVMLIYVATENMEDAYRLFTILNSRGVPLASSDILKSINLGVINTGKEQEKYAKKWEEIEDSFGEDDFDRFLSHLRAILIRQKAKSSLLNEFENIVYKKDNVLLE